MSDLSTKYLGMNLKSPLLASASPLSESVDNIKRLEDQNLAAVVLPSLFEEQLQLESMSLDSDLMRGVTGPCRQSRVVRRCQELNDPPTVIACMGSEERRVGKECVQPCRSRWSPYH